MIAIIDYGINNLESVKNALDKLGTTFIVTSDIATIQSADALILPGVGSASEGMKNLKKLNLDKVIISEVKNGKPILGICLGMQLLMSDSEEGDVDCLNLIKGTVTKFNSTNKIPQIGWNSISFNDDTNVQRLTEGISNNSYFYFVHSYYCQPNDTNIVKGITQYGQDYCSLLVKDNIVGVQFHPEKSGTVGFQLLKNVINYFI